MLAIQKIAIPESALESISDHLGMTEIRSDIEDEERISKLDAISKSMRYIEENSTFWWLSDVIDDLESHPVPPSIPFSRNQWYLDAIVEFKTIIAWLKQLRFDKSDAKAGVLLAPTDVDKNFELLIERTVDLQNAGATHSLIFHTVKIMENNLRRTVRDHSEAYWYEDTDGHRPELTIYRDEPWMNSEQ